MILNGFAIQAYGTGSLGPSLANTIIPAVERCRMVLPELLDEVGSSWLNCIGITDVLGSIWMNKWDEDELASLKMRLRHVRRPLSELLLALNS